MIADHPVRPVTLRQRSLIFVDGRGDLLRIPVRLISIKLKEVGLRLIMRPIIGDQLMHGPSSPRSSTADRIHPTPCASSLRYRAFPAGRCCTQGAVVHKFPSIPYSRILWVVRHCRSFTISATYIHPESVYAFVQPKPHYSEHRLLHFRIAPVEVGLFDEKGVVVILLRSIVPLPGAPAEDAQPVIGRTAIWLRILPDVPVALRVVPGRPRSYKPGMLVRTVIGDKVEDQLHPGRMYPCSGGRQSLPWCRKPARCLYSRKCHSQNPPSARDKWETARWP